MSVLFIAVISQFIHAQGVVWTPLKEHNRSDFTAKGRSLPRKYSAWQFSAEAFTALYVENKPNETLSTNLPMPDGNVEAFTFRETPVFSDALMQKYPGYTSFTGVSSDGQLAMKMSVSPFGVAAIITGSKEGPVLVDPLSQDGDNAYISYFKKDGISRSKQFFCGVAGDGESKEMEYILSQSLAEQAGRAITGDCQLRTYRLALACTGEYARFHGGTIPKVLAAYNTSITRVNAVYERDVAITLKLIANTDKLIFLDPATDPYTNNDGGVMLDQNQQTIDQRIGSANYDIGHVFSTGGGGIAQLRAPCGGGKARGVTGLSAPVGDPFDIDYVCHEMGHQFGANHTQNNDCQRNLSTAVEPGSASTIMGYAGICDPNVQNNSDAHFHAVSIAEIRNFIIAGGGNNCAEKTEIGNSPPQILDASKTFTIPVSTAFALSLQAEDADGDKLTYCWEQTDNDPATMPPVSTSKIGPAFRSLLPSANPTRYFPDLQKKHGQWEVTPTTSRTMRFTCTVRDNNLAAGCTATLNHIVEFTSTSGPFLVTYPNVSSVNWPAGSKQTVRWNVSKTDLAPVNCTIVDIYLSTDGGISYPHLLAKSVPNTGSFEVITPGLPTTKARVMVKAADNVFFDVSNASFKITSTFQLFTDTSFIRFCGEDTLSIPFNAQGNMLLANPLFMTATGLPQSVSVDISQPSTLDLPFSGVVTLVGVRNLPYNATTFLLTGMSGDERISIPITLYLEKNTPTDIQLLSPLPGKADVNAGRVVFSWKDEPGVFEYQLEVSNTAEFLPVIVNTLTTDTSAVTSLESGRVFFWRVKASSVCTENGFSPAQAFRTKGASSGKAVLWSNNPLLAEMGQSTVFTDSQLSLSTQNPGFVLCNIRELPRHGSLILEGKSLTQGTYFTMEDVLLSRLFYKHNNGDERKDSFLLDIVDDQGRTLDGLICPIFIKQSSLGVTAFLRSRLRCAGDQNGGIEAIAYGGTAPYFFSIDQKEYQDNSSFDGLLVGQYQIAVIDALGDTALSNLLIIDEPDPILVAPEVNFYDIFVTASGGTGRLTYSLDGNAFAEENSFPDPGNGTFQVYVKDEAQCLVTDSIQISIPALTATASLTSDIFCAGQKAGITCQASGGIPPYRYSMDGTTYQANPSFLVDGGMYNPSIKDAGGKVVTAPTVTTSMPASIQIFLIQNRLQVVVVASGGSGKLQYSADNINYSDRDTFLFAQNGIYKIYVRDEKGCIRSAEISLNVLTEVLATVTNNRCFGQREGKVSLQPTNGKGPFRYRLGSNPAGTERQFSGLAAGDYIYTVWDANNDSISGTATILQPEALLLNQEVIGDSLLLNATGGTPPYQYGIDGGLVFLDISLFDNLETGNYIPAVRDSLGCVTANPSVAIVSSLKESKHLVRFHVIPNPAKNTVSITGNNLAGTATVQCFAIHGKRMDQIAWTHTNNEWQADVSSLPSGIYFIRISDGRNMQIHPLVKINE